MLIGMHLHADVHPHPAMLSGACVKPLRLLEGRGKFKLCMGARRSWQGARTIP
jgi:hypothetical protein